MKQSLSFNHCLRVCLAAMLLTMTSCENGNLFGKLHKTGESGDVATLNSEAEIAYRERNYSRALELYERVLAQNPNNAEALYGAASAQMAGTGINLATIISNALKQNANASFINGAGDLIQRARETSVPTTQAAANSILANIDLAAIDAALDTVICRLQKISAGVTDGSIAPTDLDVLVNFGIVCLLRAIVRPLRKGLIDITNTNGTYNVVVDASLVAATCSGSNYATYGFASAAEQRAFLLQVAKDLAGAYAIYNKAVQNSALGSNSIIARLRDDLNDVNAQILATVASGQNKVPQECLDTFADNGNGITLTNFSSYTGPFTPPSGC